MLLRLFLVLFTALLGASSLLSQTFRPSGMVPGSQVDIEVSAFYENLPSRGYAPIRVFITNNSGRDRTWSVSFSSATQWGGSASVRHEAEMYVPDGESKRFDLLVPLVQDVAYPELNAKFSGHGLRASAGVVTFTSSSYRTPGTLSSVAMSSYLASRNLRLISDETGSHGGSIGSGFDLRLMPIQWRGYSGFGSVWLTDTEWERIGAAEKAALLDWVALGGMLYVCREAGNERPLDGLARLPMDHGFGVVRAWPREGDALDATAVAQHIVADVPNISGMLSGDYLRHSWQPLKDLPPVLMRSGLLLTFLVAFALLIGPVNLYVFARGTRRYRLFWTTPALSLGASAVIFLLILLQDGVGGRGHQLAIWSHLPTENKAAVVQEQVSRTSLLTSRNFSVQNPVAISRIGTGSVAAMTASTSGRQYAGTRDFAGDYFMNRSIQGHLLESVPSTRWRLELSASTAGAGPRILSTFPFDLSPVFFVDEQGRHWQTDRLASGTAATFIPSTAENLAHHMNDVRGVAGPIAERRISTISGRRNHFYAFAQNAPEATERTLGSVQWQSRSLHTGPIYLPHP